MRFSITSNLILGTYSLFGLYLLNVKADASEQPYSPEIQQIRSLASGTKIINNNNPPPVNSVESTTLESQLFKRSQRWTTDEEQRLIELREQDVSWVNIMKMFPERSWSALRSKYLRLTKNLSSYSPKKKLWTDEEDKILLKLLEEKMPLEEISESLPGRTVQALKARYYYLRRGIPVSQKTVRNWTAEEDALLLESLESGMIAKEIAPLFGRTEHAVYSHIGELNKQGRLKHISRERRTYKVADFELIHELLGTSHVNSLGI